MKTIKVLIVDDSIVFRQMLMRHFLNVPNIQIIGYAVDAAEARQKILQLNPDVVTLDVEMPGMSGIDFLKSFLPEHPIPIILVSSLNIRVFDALSYGAVDFIRKPEMHLSNSKDAFFSTLQSKIVIAAQAHVRIPQAKKCGAYRTAAYRSTFPQCLILYDHRHRSLHRRNRDNVGDFKSAPKRNAGNSCYSAYAGRIYGNVCPTSEPDLPA